MTHKGSSTRWARGAGRLAGGLIAAVLLVVATTARAQSLVPICGSPFTFSSPPAGLEANVVLLSPDERHLFVTEVFGPSITVLDVAVDGSVSFRGDFPTTPAISPIGMATNPEGTRLYVTTFDTTVNVHSIAANGALSQIQAASLGTRSAALNGISYVRVAGGDFVYVDNDDSTGNTVSAFPVNSDGTLGAAVVFPTGGFGADGGLTFAPNQRSALVSGAHLFVVNGSLGAGSGDISVFVIDMTTGALELVAGSPFSLALPGSFSSGAIAVDPAGAFLYAGTTDNTLVKFHIDPTTGALTVVPGSPFATGLNLSFFSGIDGLEVHPSGNFVLASASSSHQIAVLNTATMTAAPFSPRSAGAEGGLQLTHSGTRLFNLASGFPTTAVGVYDFGSFPPFQLTQTLSPHGTASPKSGFATISGTVTRSLSAEVSVHVDLLQKVGRKTIITGSGNTTVACGSGQSPWSVVITGSAFGPGAAFASVTISTTDPLTGAPVTQSGASNAQVQLKGGP